MSLLITFLFFFSILLETTVLSFPFTLMVLLTYFIARKTPAAFIVACVAGVCIDILQVQHVGATSIFYVMMLFLVFLYNRKYEIQSPFFIILSVFIATLLFSLSFTGKFLLVHALLNACLGGIVYKVVQMVEVRIAMRD